MSNVYSEGEEFGLHKFLICPGAQDPNRILSHKACHSKTGGGDRKGKSFVMALVRLPFSREIGGNAGALPLGPFVKVLKSFKKFRKETKK